MNKDEQITSECKNCAYDEPCSMCGTCILGSNFVSKEKANIEVTMMMAATINGIVARSSSDPVNWTPKADKDYFKRVTKNAGVVIMGSNTYQTLSGPLPDRLNIVMTRKKYKSEFQNVVFTDQHPIVILHALMKKNYTKVCLIGGPTINVEFMERNLVNKIAITVVPKFFPSGKTLCSNLLNDDYKVSLDTYESIGDGCLVLTYNVLGKEEKGVKNET